MSQSNNALTSIRANDLFAMIQTQKKGVATMTARLNDALLLLGDTLFLSGSPSLAQQVLGLTCQISHPYTPFLAAQANEFISLAAPANTADPVKADSLFDSIDELQTQIKLCNDRLTDTLLLLSKVLRDNPVPEFAQQALGVVSQIDHPCAAYLIGQTQQIIAKASAEVK